VRNCGRGPSRMFFEIFGLVCALVAILGFLKSEGPILGYISNNMPDVWLHVVLAAAMLFLGFRVSRESDCDDLIEPSPDGALKDKASTRRVSPWSN
jgi:hypothetical protein